MAGKEKEKYTVHIMVKHKMFLKEVVHEKMNVKYFHL